VKNAPIVALADIENRTITMREDGMISVLKQLATMASTVKAAIKFTSRQQMKNSWIGCQNGAALMEFLDEENENLHKHSGRPR